MPSLAVHASMLSANLLKIHLTEVQQNVPVNPSVQADLNCFSPSVKKLQTFYSHLLSLWGVMFDTLQCFPQSQTVFVVGADTDVPM